MFSSLLRNVALIINIEIDAFGLGIFSVKVKTYIIDGVLSAYDNNIRIKVYAANFSSKIHLIMLRNEKYPM